MQPRSFSGRNPPVWKAPVSLIINWRGPGGFLPTSADSATLGSIVIVLACHLRPPPDMSPYLLNLIKNILLISPMHIIHKILWGIFISSRIQHRGDQSCKVNLVRSFCVEMQKKNHQRRHCLCLTGNSNYRAYYCSRSLKSSAHWDAKIHTWYGAGETESSPLWFGVILFRFFSEQTPKTDAAPANQPWNDLAPSWGDD